jgi:signal transduction histidine kinase/ligand-binding sensor domain-containing protein/DNA-binding response OmpR family regulator
MVRLTVFCLLLCWCLDSQAGNIRWRYIGIEQGLSNNAVTSVFRDHRGFMWFGTYDGLNRYDGYTFKTYRNVLGDSNSLRDNHIYAIAEDSSNQLWVASAGGICIYDLATGRFHIPHIDAPDGRQNSYGVSSMCYVQGVGMLAASQNQGLLLFPDKQYHGYTLPLAQKGEYTATAVGTDPKGGIWAIVYGRGFYRYDLKTGVLREWSHAFRQGNSFCFSGDSVLYLGTSQGFFRYNMASGSLSPNLLSGTGLVRKIIRGRDRFWIATDGIALWYYQENQPQAVLYQNEQGKSIINGNAAYDIVEDPSGRQWVGTLHGGINLIEHGNAAFQTVLYNGSGAMDNFVHCFCPDLNNNLWVGTQGAGLRYWDRRQNSFRNYVRQSAEDHSLSSNFITCMTLDSLQDLWVGTWFGGINRLRRGTNAFEHFACRNPYSGATENNIWVLYTDKKGRLWASTTNDGTLYNFDRRTKQFVLFDSSISNIQSMAEDRAGVLWAGNYNHLIRLDVNKKKHISYDIGYPVRSIHEDRLGQLWIGTEGGGLLLLDRHSGQFTRYSTREGLPNNSVLRMEEDKNGNIWLSTYYGLCQFDPVSRRFRNYTPSDGLQSNQFVLNASALLPSGEMAFGGIRGFNLFHPDSIYDHTEQPSVFITGIHINSQSTTENNDLVIDEHSARFRSWELPYNKAALAVDFVGLTYTGSDKIQYAYQLEGWDKSWNYVNGARTANYSRLEEGNYRFLLKVSDASGKWGREKAMLQIRVLPPLYRTWWAWILYAAAFATAIYIYIRYTQRQHKMQYEVQIARLEREKEKEMGEKRISFFTHIAHEFRTPLTLIISPLKELLQENKVNETGKKLSLVYRNAKRLLSLTDQLLLFRKAESLDQHLQLQPFSITELCKETALSFSQHAHSKNIRFYCEVPEQAGIISADKEKIEIILFNLLSNAFKYTPAGGTVALTVRQEASAIRIFVQDSGTGIAPDTGEKIFESFYRGDKNHQSGFGIGLYVSRRLARAHQGELSYKSTAGNGTVFELMLPAAEEITTAPLLAETKTGSSEVVSELMEDSSYLPVSATPMLEKLSSELPIMLVVDDNPEIRNYISEIFSAQFQVFEAADGLQGYAMAEVHAPEIILSDIAMENMDGILLCQKIKSSPSLSHIPLVLLTGSGSDESRIKGFECGADDYITKPFDKELIVIRVKNILQGRKRLRDYFLNAVTLQPNDSFAGEHKEFMDRCIAVVERNMSNPSFNIQQFCRELGMSHPSLYKKVKTISGLTINVFIRYLRLRKAASLLINTDKTIAEVTYITGFNDIRYFREQFSKLFAMNPSEYVRRYRRVLGAKNADGA